MMPKPKRISEAPWSVVVNSALAVLGMAAVAAADPGDGNRIDIAGESGSSADLPAAPAATVVSGAEESLTAARQAVEAASAEVARLEAAKKQADKAADQAIANATKGLGTAPVAGANDEEAARLRAGVVRAINASDDAGRALNKARAALAAAEQAAAEETALAVERVRAAQAEAEKNVLALSSESARFAEELKRAVADVSAAEAVRRDAEAEEDRLKRAALAAIDKAAAARRALAEARAASTAIAEELEKLTTEGERLAAKKDSRPQETTSRPALAP